MTDTSIPPDDEPKPPDQPPPDPEDESFAARVEQSVRKALGGLIGKGEVKVEEGKKEPAKEEPAQPATAKQEEANAEDTVRAALTKITADDEHAREHERLKKEAERQPVTVGRLTRALWGGPE